MKSDASAFLRFSSASRATALRPGAAAGGNLVVNGDFPKFTSDRQSVGRRG